MRCVGLGARRSQPGRGVDGHRWHRWLPAATAAIRTTPSASAQTLIGLIRPLCGPSQSGKRLQVHTRHDLGESVGAVVIREAGWPGQGWSRPGLRRRWGSAATAAIVRRPSVGPTRDRITPLGERADAEWTLTAVLRPPQSTQACTGVDSSRSWRVVGARLSHFGQKCADRHRFSGGSCICLAGAKLQMLQHAGVPGRAIDALRDEGSRRIRESRTTASPRSAREGGGGLVG
jgi:hypothetical protein